MKAWELPVFGMIFKFQTIKTISLFCLSSNLMKVFNLFSYDFSDGFSMVAVNALDRRASTMASMKADVRYVQKRKRKTYLTICHKMNLILAKTIWPNYIRNVPYTLMIFKITRQRNLFWFDLVSKFFHLNINQNELYKL